MSYSLTFRLSPNRSMRSGAPRFFVMHVTEGAFDGAVSWLCNPSSQVSADEVVDLAGTRVAVLNDAASQQKTWAVGDGNSVSMSWENEGNSGVTRWPDSHYATLADRLRKAQAEVKRVYGVTIPLKRTTTPGVPGICGHGDMARWFGGSDHYGCPGTTFDFAKLEKFCNPTITRYRYVIRSGAGRLLYASLSPRGFRRIRWTRLFGRNPKAVARREEIK